MKRVDAWLSAQKKPPRDFRSVESPCQVPEDDRKKKTAAEHGEKTCKRTGPKQEAVLADAFRLNVLLGAAALTKRHGCVKQRTTNDQTRTHVV